MAVKQMPGKEIPAIDYGVFLLCTVLSVFSCTLMVLLYLSGQIQARSVIMQLTALFIGFFAAVFIAKINYRLVSRLVPVLVILGITLMLLLKVPGLAYMPEGSDDLAWIRVGYFSMQPSETLKIIFIYTFSLHLSKVKDHLNRPSTLFLLCLHGLIPVLLVVNTGDLGSALVIFLMFVLMTYAAGLSRGWIGAGLVLILAAIPAGWKLLPDYLKNRFLYAWHPELDIQGTGYQQYQGLLALQNGGWTGKGLSSSDLVSVPECYNDFVFTYVGQKFGFVGCLLVVLLLCMLMIWVLSIAAQSGEALGRSLCIGVFAMLFSQFAINLGMVLCLIPVVGLTLPFISCGGTSLCVSFAGIGMVMSVYRFHPNPTIMHTSKPIENLERKRRNI